MADKPVLLGPDGQPIRPDLMLREIATPSGTIGVRSPFADYPADGLNPRRLANILREADRGNPRRYFELAEQIEERDPHYVGILGTRRRSVAQLDIQVDAADDSAEAKAHADMVEAWLGRDELQDELFHMLDAIGKGISFTEIIWDTSEGQWQPTRLIHRDPRWFSFDRVDGETPLLEGGYDGVEQRLTVNYGGAPLPAFKFVVASIAAKSGLPVRSGLARLAAWSWMFKAFTMRDWAIFAQTFGQPVRLGKYPAGASDADKNTLFRAVANIAGDCAAIVPESMAIDFIQAPNIGASHALYKERADWLDQQMSKAVLGQTATTDAIAGGHAVGQEHRQVQEDIERADAKALSAILNRDLIQPWVQLQFGPQKNYPRLRIGRPDEKNVTQIIDGIARGVPLGLQVEKSWLNDLLGIPVPAKGADVLTAPAQSSPFGGFDMPGYAPHAPTLQASHSPPQQLTALQTLAALNRKCEDLCGPGINDLVGEVRDVVMRAKSLQEVQAALSHAKPGLAEFQLAGLMQMARVLANLVGRSDIADA